MIRKSTINLKFANNVKLEKVKLIAEEYQRIVNIFMDRLWKQQQFSGSFIKDAPACRQAGQLTAGYQHV